NAINLSDGLDGLAGGISLLSFICIGYLAYLGGHPAITILSVAVVGAIFGFLRFNTYPAVLFMGDTGSQFLGFLAASLSLRITQGNTPLSPILPLIILGFPVLDTLTVMIERIHEGKSPFAADKKHLHHKLINLGFFHTEAVLVIYILQAFLVTSAFIFRFYSDWLLLAFYMISSGVILILFFVFEKAGWKLKRTGFFDKAIKGRLRVLKEKNILIRVSFRTLEIGVPLLLLFTCFLAKDIPDNFAFLVLAILGLLIIIWLFKKNWLVGALRLTLYLTIPFAVYLTHMDMGTWANERLIQLYNLSFGGIVIFAILTLKFTRRREGFKISPMDFLILFIALVVPNVPDDWIRSYHIGLLATKVIVLFFGYEVIIGELRDKLNRIGVATLAALMVLSIKGVIILLS
ncbi:MAG: MraY family glycosyltransferase, partial [Pseudomonadota bacterium]